MNVKDGRWRAALTHRVGADATRRSRRRAFLLAAVSWSALGWVDMARAQPAKPAKVMRVGLFLLTRSDAPNANRQVFVDAMRELGWIEGRNIVYDIVHAEGDRARYPAVAAQLVAKAPDLIHVVPQEAAMAAYKQTHTIPIVAAAMGSPVRSGLVESLARPGGNVTGIATIGGELGGKRLQFVYEALPKVSRIGVLVTGTRNSLDELKLIEQAARPGTHVTRATAAAVGDFDAAFRVLAESRTEALLVTHQTLFISERKRLLPLAAKHRIAVIGPRSELADDGALMSYSSNLTEQVRRSAHLADKVLKGTKPADIPVEQPTQFELVINLKTARALGITIPQLVLLQASRVIE